MNEILKYIQLYTGCNDHALKRIEAILETKFVPASKVEVKYVEKFIRKGVGPLLPLSKWAEQYYLLNDTSYAELSKKKRSEPIVVNRNRFFREAYKEGYSLSELGRFLNFNHSSVIYAIHESKKI